MNQFSRREKVNISIRKAAKKEKKAETILNIINTVAR
jgi:hypothetical protein